MTANKPRVGVSRCLLGDPVRYDGRSKACRIVIEQLAAQFELIAICPEVEAGLPVPRPPVRLTGNPQQPRLIGRDDPAIDITATLTAYCQRCIPRLDTLHGFIFKSRSPSCGLGTTPVFEPAGRCLTETASGVFAQAFCERYPEVPVIDDIGLGCEPQLGRFLDRVWQHHANSEH